tara:strand:- start:1881 stop:2468 length:588 start_codon:yes stop_codon:yes gene_type:complete
MNKQIVCIILLLLLFGIIFLKKKIKFTEFIRLESDFYIPRKNNIVDFRKKSINAHRICVFDDTNPNNVDLECINANELLTTLNLPDQRKNEVCIDNKCLTKEDLQVMNGTRDIKLKSKAANMLGFNDMCLNNSNIKSHLCGAEDINIYSLMPQFCYKDSVLKFKLEKGVNNESNLNRFDKKSSDSIIVEEEPGHH